MSETGSWKLETRYEDVFVSFWCRTRARVAERDFRAGAQAKKRTQRNQFTRTGGYTCRRATYRRSGLVIWWCLVFDLREQVP